MPLLVLPADDAFARQRNPASRWPRSPEAQAERLMPLARPSFSPSFRLGKGELVFTVGSCFARNIEKQLMVEGYDVAVSRFTPLDDVGSAADPDAMLNRYVVFSILNELRWALEPGQAFPEAAYVELRPGQWIDPHLNAMATPAPLELVRRRRAATRDYMALAGQARVVVMTLGLAEAWFDRATGLYVNGAPPIRRTAAAERFELHLLDYEQILGALEEIWSILSRHGHPDLCMLVTVSPVAMNTSFSGEEVLAANTYSKSVQRAAVEAFVRRHDNVDYFPSYESVVLSDRQRAWRADQAHASDEIVRLNVLRMVEAYGAKEEAAAPSAAAAKAFAQAHKARRWADAGDVARARNSFAKAARLAPHEGLVLLEYGRFLMEQGEYENAAKLIKASVREGSGAYGGLAAFAQVLFLSKRYDAAFKAAHWARERQPTRPSVLHLSALISRKLGRREEALAFAEACTALDPASLVFRRLRDGLRRQIARQARMEQLKGLLKRGVTKPSEPAEVAAG